ncbi:MAG: electron transfer flavoprotein subunit alpha/FixB family protein [SAR324 cluster bacterium]|nr:electron transfer flavoprotein subunit alpha/FixB family protein [SAR324 cluster bacterium]
MTNQVWVWLEHSAGALDNSVFGLLHEAERWCSKQTEKFDINIVALGSELKEAIAEMGFGLAERVILWDDPLLNCFQGELYAQLLADWVLTTSPAGIFMADSAQGKDLAPRLAAKTGVSLITRAVDFKVNDEGGANAIRPIASGHLFEEIQLERENPFIITFLPSVLSEAEPDFERKPEIVPQTVLKTQDDSASQLKQIIRADPGEIDLEDSNLILAIGRGIGKDKGFEIVQEFAETIGASIGATRPVVDWGTVSFDRQIGQTGKTVAPDLIINCGISGANEYTAGMEKAKLVIAINTDSRARIFRFADLGLVGDVNELLPLLIEKIRHVEKQN